MPISTQEIERIAELACLNFTPVELSRFAHYLDEILKYFEQLETVSTGEVEPLTHALRLARSETPMREDQVGESFPVEVALKEAPDSSEGHFRVPRVIEERE
ncbi:MAG: Asp-tRNA(Asn)/Glu-tRNA(Gln) amidotransferase subunit GatC [Acidobacteriota bacterium]